MIAEREQRIIKERLDAELAGRVRLDYFTQRKSALIVPGRAECKHCEDIGGALQDVAALHHRIALTVHEFDQSRIAAEKLGVARVPCIVIRGQANRALRFYGLPGGHQFPVLIQAIVMSSQTPPQVEREALAKLRKLRAPTQISVFVTPWCEYSATVADAAYRMALAQANVKAEVVEISEYPDVAKRFQLTATPTIVIDDRLAIHGLVDDLTLATHIVQTLDGDAAGVRAIDAGPATPFDPQSAGQPDAMPETAAPRIYVPGR